MIFTASTKAVPGSDGYLDPAYGYRRPPSRRAGRRVSVKCVAYCSATALLLLFTCGMKAFILLQLQKRYVVCAHKDRTLPVSTKVGPLSGQHSSAAMRPQRRSCRWHHRCPPRQRPWTVAHCCPPRQRPWTVAPSHPASRSCTAHMLRHLSACCPASSRPID